MTKKETENLQKIKGRIDRETIVDRKAWKFVRELNSSDEERLNRIALIDGRRKYTFRQLFRSWDRYAEVFAALDICEQSGSRVGLIGNISSECIIAFYALNMLGVSVSMIPVEETYDEERLHETIEKEEITDIVLSVGYAWPGILRMISKERKEGTLRNAIVLRTYVDGPFAAPLERLQSKLYGCIVNVCPDVDIMDRLFDHYEATSFTPSSKKNDEAAVITHT